MKKLNTNGFGTAEGALILVVVALVIAAGFYAYQRMVNNTTTTSSDAAQREVQAPVDETARWEKLTSGQGGFSVKIPDGWRVISSSDADFAFAGKEDESDLDHTEGTPATITVQPSLGFDGGTRFAITQQPASQVEHYLHGDEEEKTFNAGTLKGKRYHRQAPFSRSVGLGPQPGQIDYTYIFEASGKATILTYTIYQKNDHGITTDDKNRLPLIEKVVKTLEVQ